MSGPVFEKRVDNHRQNRVWRLNLFQRVASQGSIEQRCYMIPIDLYDDAIKNIVHILSKGDTEDYHTKAQEKLNNL